MDVSPHSKNTGGSDEINENPNFRSRRPPEKHETANRIVKYYCVRSLNVIFFFKTFRTLCIYT